MSAPPLSVSVSVSDASDASYSSSSEGELELDPANNILASSGGKDEAPPHYALPVDGGGGGGGGSGMTAVVTPVPAGVTVVMTDAVPQARPHTLLSICTLIGLVLFIGQSFLWLGTGPSAGAGALLVSIVLIIFCMCIPGGCGIHGLMLTQKGKPNTFMVSYLVAVVACVVLWVIVVIGSIVLAVEEPQDTALVLVALLFLFAFAGCATCAVLFVSRNPEALGHARE